MPSLELFRLLVSQFSERYSQKATSSKEHAEILDTLLESTKPNPVHSEWDILISTPFRYPLPVQPEYAARFRPPYFTKNVFYGASQKTTAAFEASYHFLRQRVHLPKLEETGSRTLFEAHAKLENIKDLRKHKFIKQIMNKYDYTKSHEIALQYPNADGFLYPSCRDPEKSLCAAFFKIQHFDKDVKREWEIRYTYDGKTKSLKWERLHILNMTVDWHLIN